MIGIRNLTPRSYQTSIAKTAENKNTLVVLPTGIGKTAISILLSVSRLNKFPNSKILFCSPTKPLCQQHVETFREYTSINNEEVNIYTGAVKIEERPVIWGKSKIIIATPQTIQKGIEKNLILLDNISLLCIDECHRSRQNYANTVIAKVYCNQAENPRILALTASPGNTKEKIEEIRNNLFIETIEIRTEQDEDVKPYLQQKKVEWISIELSDDLKKLQGYLQNIRKSKLKDLSKVGYTKPISLITKKDLLALQIQLRNEILKKNQIAFYGISLVAQLLKLEHCLELLETQDTIPLKEFIEKLEGENTKAAKSLLKNKDFINVVKLTNNLVDKNVRHPKIKKIKDLIESQLKEKPNSKIIIFANFRNTVDILYKTLKDSDLAKPVKLIGQKGGITQKQQINVIKEFEEDIHNIIICTSIGEEGLSIGSLDLAVFYDNVPSGIRRIQRGGRVARIKPGKIIHLLTENTRDIAYYWKSRKDEKIMKNIIDKMKNIENVQGNY